MVSVCQTFEKRLQLGESVILATILETWVSTPGKASGNIGTFGGGAKASVL